MKLDKSKINRVDLKNENADDGYVQADGAELLSMVWEITKDAYAFVRGADAERRLQRDVGNLNRRES